MTPFQTLTGIAASLIEDNLDTDVIFPARFLLLLDRSGLGAHAFHDRRFTPDGAERVDFVLNQAAYRDAKILLAGRNFGSGSSREQAVWCLADFGVRCVIAQSFGEIFAANCVNNGVAPITLPGETIARMARAGQPLTVDLVACRITVPGAPDVPFAIPAAARDALLEGRDVTARILATQRGAITAYETRRHAEHPWLLITTES